MRLGQLARKLSVKPGEIMEFLRQEDSGIDGGTNSRLSEDQVRRIVEAIAPDQLDLILNTSEVDEEASVIGEVATVEETEIEAEQDVEESEVVNEDTSPLEVQEIEVIRAPKVELPGLRVVGKIELPEPKQKEPEADSSSPDDITSDQPSEIGRERSQNRDRRGGRFNKHSGKNRVLLQREREEMEARKKKEAENEKEKQRRTENYLKKFKTSDSTSAKKKIKKTIQPVALSSKVTDEKPTSVVVKFKKWLFRE